MEKAVMHLLALSSSAINLAISRLRRSSIISVEDKKDVDVKSLLMIKDAPKAAMSYLASSFAEISGSPHALIVGWMSRECPESTFETIDSLLRASSLSDERNDRNAKRIAFAFLKLLASCAAQIDITLLERLLPSLLTIIETNGSYPKVASLLARDVFWFICVRCVKANSDETAEDARRAADFAFRNKDSLLSALETELSWTKQRSDLLSLGFNDLIEILSAVIKASSNEVVAQLPDKPFVDFRALEQKLERSKPHGQTTNSDSVSAKSTLVHSTASIKRPLLEIEPNETKQKRSGISLHIVGQDQQQDASKSASKPFVVEEMVAPSSLRRGFFNAEKAASAADPTTSPHGVVETAFSSSQSKTAVESKAESAFKETLSNPQTEDVSRDDSNVRSGSIEFIIARGFDLQVMVILLERRWDADHVTTLADCLNDPNADISHACISLRNLCLLLGRDKVDLSSESAKNLMEGSLRALNDAKMPPQYQKMASVLFKYVVALFSQTKPDESSLANKLLPLLDVESKDGISMAASELLAEAIFEDPKTLLGELDLRLSSKEKHKRENAAFVLGRVIELRCKRLRRDDQVDEILTKILLGRLGDEKIDVRKQLSRAVTFLRPQLVAPKLCAMLNDKSEKKRSNAIEAMSLMLRETFDFAGLVETLLGHVDSVEDQDRFFQLTSRWMASISISGDSEVRFNILLEILVRESVEKAKDNPLLIGFARRLAEYIVEKPSRMEAYCSLVLNEIKSMPASLSLVEKLAPLLLLRVLPIIELANHEDLLSELTMIILSAKEEKDLKRIACECLARIAGITPWEFFLSVLDDDESLMKTADMNDKLELIRACIYGCCQALTAQVIMPMKFGADSFPFVACKVVLSLCDRLQKISSANEEHIQKSLLGAQEFLSLAAFSEGLRSWVNSGRALNPSAEEAKAAVEEVDEGSETNEYAELKTLNVLLERLFSGEDDRSSIASMTLCLIARSLVPANANQPPNSMLASVLRTLPEQTRNDLDFATSGFAALVTTNIMSRWSNERSPTEHELLVIFNVAFASIKREMSFCSPLQLSALFDVALTLLNSLSARDPKSRVLALRILGTLLVVPEKQLTAALSDGTLARVQSALQGLGNVDPNAEVRALAAELLRLSFNM